MPWKPFSAARGLLVAALNRLDPFRINAINQLSAALANTPETSGLTVSQKNQELLHVRGLRVVQPGKFRVC